MTSSLPGIVQWPVFAFVGIVIAGRYVLVADTSMDQLATRALLFGLICDLLRNDGVEKVIAGLFWMFDDVDVINLVRQASFGPLLVSIMCIYGMARLAASPDDESTTVWRRQRRYDAVALAATVVFLGAGTPAREHDMLIDEYQGWGAAIAWIAYYGVLFVASISIIHIMIGEFRDGDNTTRETTIYLVVLGYFGYLALESIYVPAESVTAVLTGSTVMDPSMQSRAITAFLALCIGTAILAVPLLGAAIVRTRWDRPGRYCRRLRPLWSDLTDSCPDVILQRPATGTSADSISQLHRMSMEIRDCLVRLNQYAQDRRPDHAAGLHGDALYEYAQQISVAVAKKRSGQPPPSPPLGHAGYTPRIAHRRDLTAELDQLVDLARIWRRVHR